MVGAAQFSTPADSVDSLSAYRRRTREAADESIDDRLWMGRDFPAIATGATAAGPASSHKMAGPAAVNNGPVVTLAPIYASDFESPGDAPWYTTISGESLVPLLHESDGTGNTTLVSAGPWWTDLNHISPGAGQLHLTSTLFVDGSNGGIVIDDLRDVTFSFDIKAEGLELPEGAHIYLWFQAIDPTLPWGVGQYVNYVNVRVPVEEFLIDGAFAHVSITLSQIESDWLALGSSLDRAGDYSQSSSIVTALSGIPVDLGLVIFMGNEPSGPPASGLIRLDNVLLSHGDVIRLKFAPDALAGGFQPLHLDVAVTDADTATFENYRLSVGYQNGGLSGEGLGLVFAGGSDLTTVGGVLYLGAAQIGTVAGGSNGGALLIEISAAVDSAVVSDVINAVAYRNNGAVAGATRNLVVTLEDEPGGTASFAVEIMARLPLDDGSGNDHLIGTGANEALKGGLGNDWLEGAAGDDRLDGGTGDDILHGGTGDDWFYVDSAGDIVSETIGEGSLDRVFASVSYVLTAGAEVEFLTTIFNAALDPIDLTGNERANFIYGNAGANRLDGAGGDDALIGNEGDDILYGGIGDDIFHGGIGDDFFFVDNANDQIFESAGQGSDRVFASVSYALAAGAEIEAMSTTLHIGLDAIKLTGNELANTIYGNDGANFLDGRAGTDILVGRFGDDFYFVDSADDLIFESAGEGSDRVFAKASYTLAAGAEIEAMSTTLDIGFDAIKLTGNELANTIYGNAGANFLDGRAGTDILVGRQGDDFYFVDNADDRIVESAGEGSDRVFAKASYTLAAGAEIEVMSTALDIGFDAINLTGNELANSLYGNAGANILDGRAGADVLVGRLGDDFFFVDNADDRILESAGQGSDRVFASASYALGAGMSVEMLTTDFHAGTAAINLTGNELANTIYGNAGANRLEGGAGSDQLIANEGDDILDGGAGNDILHGGIGRDTFLFSQDTGTDRIMDFSVGGSGHDLIALPGLGIVTLAAFITNHVSQIGADTMISWNGAELILVNVNASTLLPDHFVLI